MLLLVDSGRVEILNLHYPLGIYQCVVQSDHDEAQAGAELRLGDVAPLLLETFPLRQVADNGQAVSIRCVAVATPLPQIRWLLDGQPLPNLPRYRIGDHVTPDGKVVSFVNISAVRIVDGGQYTCLATNEVGRVAHHGLVLVAGGPSLRTAFWGAHNLSVVAGHSAVVRCPAVGYPLESVTWEFNGAGGGGGSAGGHQRQQLPTNHRQSIEPIADGAGGVLTIKDVHAAQDGGEYVCTTRVAGQADTSRSPVRGVVQLAVHFAPKIDRHTLPTQLSAKQGDRIKLICSVIEGDQPIEIQWLRGNKVVRPSEAISIQNGEDYSLLTFKNVLLSDSDQW